MISNYYMRRLCEALDNLESMDSSKDYLDTLAALVAECERRMKVCKEVHKV